MPAEKRAIKFRKDHPELAHLVSGVLPKPKLKKLELEHGFGSGSVNKEVSVTVGYFKHKRKLIFRLGNQKEESRQEGRKVKGQEHLIDEPLGVGRLRSHTARARLHNGQMAFQGWQQHDNQHFRLAR